MVRVIWRARSRIDGFRAATKIARGHRVAGAVRLLADARRRGSRRTRCDLAMDQSRPDIQRGHERSIATPGFFGPLIEVCHTPLSSRYRRTGRGSINSARMTPGTSGLWGCRADFS